MDRLARRYRCRPSDLMYGPIGDLLFDLEVATEGSRKDKEELDGQK